MRAVKWFSGACGLALWLALGPADAAGSSTLFVHLGGIDGVTAIANQLIDDVVADPVLGRSFRDSNLKRIKLHLAEQLCELAGGPCHYGGDGMREVHAGHDISEAEFYGMVESLKRILAARGVALPDRNRLLALLAPLKRDIVRVPADGR
jgi:hemoglobin